MDLPLYLPSEQLFETENYKILTEILKNMKNIKQDLYEYEKNCILLV